MTRSLLFRSAYDVLKEGIVAFDPGAQTLLFKSNRMLSCPNGALPIADDFDASVSVMSCGSCDIAATGPLNIWPVGRLYNAG